MPINNADFPIADNEPEIKIDNLVERVYLYRAESILPYYNGLRFYKYKQKFDGLDTFISENGIYYIWANRIGGNTGRWTISIKIGTTYGGVFVNSMYGNSSTNFFTTKFPIEGNYSNTLAVTLFKITSDTR